MSHFELQLSAQGVSKTLNYPEPEIVAALHQVLIRCFASGLRYVDLIHQTATEVQSVSIPNGALFTSVIPKNLDTELVRELATRMANSLRVGGSIKFDADRRPVALPVPDDEADAGLEDDEFGYL